MVRRLIAFLYLAVLSAAVALAGDPGLPARGPRSIHGGPGTTVKAVVDTINLMASHGDPTNGPGEPAYYGDFEDAFQYPAWNGWTSVDLSRADYAGPYWQASDFRRIHGDFSAFCGDPDLPSCGAQDSVGGYGHNLDERLEWRRVVANPAQPCTVTVDAVLNLDTMDGYDYGYLSVLTGSSTVTDIWVDGGLVDGYHLQETFVYQPGDYTGESGDEVVLQFRVTSDGGWDGADCAWPNDGAIQLDDVAVILSQGPAGTFDDFEDGTLGNWTVLDPPGVGDFAQLWVGLEDLDPCFSNWSPQVAFIDDGLVVPGTGPSECINWCYGPMGYIVNTTGGLLGYGYHLHDGIESPAMDWPDNTYDGLLFTFGVYRHEDLSADAPGMFYTWGVRSADTDGSAGDGAQVLAEQPWRDRGFLYWGDPEYLRDGDDVSDLMNPGRDQVQVQLTVYEMGWIWGWDGDDGYPAPYFDNVTLKVYDRDGPAMTARIPDLAQDAFPESGTLDFLDRGSLSVRFDMARNIALDDPGDSVVVRVSPLGAGAVLSPVPRLQYVRRGNAVYDPYRTAGLPDEAFVDGAEVLDEGGQPTGEWAFDLPDTGFLFPGDELHYLIVATETGPGGTVQAFLPPDTTGFHDFSGPLGYDPDFTMRALPGLEDWYNKTVITSGGPALFWFDAADLSGLETWIAALEEFNPVGQTQFTTFDFDVFVSRSPTETGLGARATVAQLDHYGTVLYSSGDEFAGTLMDSPAHDDIGLLDAWLAVGDKRLLLAGDGLASDLADSYAGGQFLANRMGVSVVTDDLRPLIDNQVAPVVEPDPGAGIFFETPSWVAYGGCAKINRFDGVEPVNGGVRAAEFTDPVGGTGAYSYAAMTLRTGDGNAVISLPYDLMFVYVNPSDLPPNPYSARTSLLGDVLHAFSYMWGPVGDVPGRGEAFAVDAHPNPFNPRVTIAYTVPGPGVLSVKIYDVRGRLVRTVLDERVETGGEAVWDGRDDGGRDAASGVYFYEVRQGRNVDVGKLALVR